YTIPFVKAGPYKLAAESDGFKAYERTGIVIDNAASVRLAAKLEFGAVTELVTVTEEAPQLKPENPSGGGAMKTQSIANMLLVDRRAAQLVRLNGFVVQNGTGGTFQLAGGRGDNTMWTLDGGSTQNMLLGVASLMFDPPIESLDE